MQERCNEGKLQIEITENMENSSSEPESDSVDVLIKNHNK